MNTLQISEIQVVPIKPFNGLVAFSSCIINNQFYLGNIAIYTSPSSSKAYRLVFPNKKLTSGQTVDYFYPITKEAGELLSRSIINKYIDLMSSWGSYDL